MLKVRDPLAQFGKYALRPAGLLGAIALLLLAIVIFAAVVARLVGISIVGADETAQLLIVFMIFLSITVTQSQGGHIRMEAFVSMLPPRGRRITDFLSLMVCTTLSILLLYGTTLQAWDAYAEGEYQFGTMQFPLWPARSIIALGFLLFVIQQALEIVSFFSPQAEHQPAKPTAELN